MPAMKSESWHFDTLGEMLAIAASMEKEAIDGYLDLSARMSAFGRPDLAEVFNALVAEETDHLDKVREWSAVSGTEDTLTETTAEKLFDDEGAGIVAPELLSAYRAFSMAVRNEERAFMFWTYVSAHAQSREIRHAAERMAREELGHVAKLRSERRRAFHLERAKVSHARPDLRVLEDRLSRRLEATAANAKSGEREIVQEQCLASRSRMTSMEERGFQVDLPLDVGLTGTMDAALPLSEHILDCYLYLGDHAASEQDADRAQDFAAQLISCIQTVRRFAL